MKRVTQYCQSHLAIALIAWVLLATVQQKKDCYKIERKWWAYPPVSLWYVPWTRGSSGNVVSTLGFPLEDGHAHSATTQRPELLITAQGSLITDEYRRPAH